MAKASICCSIEMEPKTLNQGQIHQAREVAADVVQKLEPSEASVVFIDTVEWFNPVNQTIEIGAELSPPPDYKEGRGRCQCSCLSTESPNQLQLLKEPLSAPF